MLFRPLAWLPLPPVLFRSRSGSGSCRNEPVLYVTARQPCRQELVTRRTPIRRALHHPQVMRRATLPSMIRAWAQICITRLLRCAVSRLSFATLLPTRCKRILPQQTAGTPLCTEQCPSPESTTAAAVVLTVDELKERLLQIFTGCGERPTASTGLRSMGAVTVALILNVMAAVTAVMGSHAKPGPHREEMVRCCGDLDNEEARGYLINDAVGRPLLYRDDDRAENHARDVGKRVWNAAAKAEREMAAQKERDATAVRAAKRAAAKDPTKEPAVLDAERARDTSRAATLAAPVELDLPAVTVGSKLTRITHELMCQHQKAAARKAAAEAACRDAELKSDTASRIYLDIGPITLKNADEMQAAVMERVAAAYAFQDAAVAWNEAADACEAAHDSCIRALEAQCEAAQEELTEARSKRQCVMEKAALDALIRCYQDCPWTVEPV